MAKKSEADSVFKVAMLRVFGGTVLNVFALTALPKMISNGIVRLFMPGKWMPQVLVYVEGLGYGLSWFQDLSPGYFYVLAHGNVSGPVRPPQGRERESFVAMPLSATDLAKAIKGHRYYTRGKPVVMISCKVGGGNYPNLLADLLGAPVYASPDFVNILALTLKGRTSFPSLNWHVWTPG